MILKIKEHAKGITKRSIDKVDEHSNNNLLKKEKLYSNADEM